MNKVILFRFCMALSIFWLILFSSIVIVFAQPGSPIENSIQPGYRLSVETDHLRLTDSNVFTTYLPIILRPPPPSPKKGLASPICADLTTLRASWYFNWSPTPAACGPDQAEKFVPRIFSANSMPLLSVAIANAQASGWLIGFSEPNLPWQANLSPAQGAVLWKQIEDAAVGIKLVSPSPNQWEPGQNGQFYGHQWTWAMVDAYRSMYGRNPRFDAIAWNIYKRTPAESQAYLTARHNEALARGYDVPIWVLEYAGECWNGAGGNTGNQEIMTALTAWFDATPWIGRYAWFSTRLFHLEPGTGVDYTSCSLINGLTGSSTLLGQLYTSY